MSGSVRLPSSSAYRSTMATARRWVLSDSIPTCHMVNTWVSRTRQGEICRRYSRRGGLMRRVQSSGTGSRRTKI